MGKDILRPLIERARGGDEGAFARLLTEIDQRGEQSLMEQDLLAPTHQSFRIGITGPPGAGKSTLVNHMIGDFRRLGLKVGVLAVDPSSPFSKGAILGDRIRYADFVMDEGVFIRSLGTRGSLGGLSAAAYLMLRAFDACHFDVVLIETVGVGQTELEVIHVADVVAVVVVPESGDSIQAMKAGLMEIADIFVVNKSDRPGADQMIRELGGLGEVVRTVATKGHGVSELSQKLWAFQKDPQWIQLRVSPQRLQQEAKALLRQKWEREVEGRLSQVTQPQDLLSLVVDG